MKNTMRLIIISTASFLCLGGFNVVAMNGGEDEPTTEIAKDCNQETDEKHDEERIDDSKEEPIVEDDAKLVEVTIDNRCCSSVRYAQVEALGDLGFISEDHRWLSKGFQRAKSWWNGSTYTLESGKTEVVTLDPTKSLSFYVVDLSRTFSNVKNGAIVVSAVSAMCAGAVNCSPTTTIASALKAKSSYGLMARPGERISCNIPSGSTIVLSNPKRVSKTVDADHEIQQDEEYCAIVIEIIPPEGQ